jgi:hypothetical protein
MFRLPRCPIASPSSLNLYLIVVITGMAVKVISVIGANHRSVLRNSKPPLFEESFLFRTSDLTYLFLCTQAAYTRFLGFRLSIALSGSRPTIHCFLTSASPLFLISVHKTRSSIFSVFSLGRYEARRIQNRGHERVHYVQTLNLTGIGDLFHIICYV